MSGKPALATARPPWTPRQTGRENEQEASMPDKKSQRQPVVDQPLGSKRKEPDFEADLRRPEQEREARRKGASLSSNAASPIDRDDRQILRGVNQEDEHHKRRQDD
jgi:hypothetical protein